MGQNLPVGKLPIKLLERLIMDYCEGDSRVVLGAGIGKDATVIGLKEGFMVLKIDPITFATDQIGWYAVHVNANDVACLGARPRWFLATLLLPEESTTEELVENVFCQMRDACREIGAVLCGGHTEVSLGLKRPIVVGAMVGEVGREGLVRSDGARPGDIVLLTKGIAIEGTSVLAREYPGISELLSRDVLDLCKGLLLNPGISVVKEALAASSTGAVHSMHDPTEGGIVTALWEMARASGVKIVVKMDQIHIREETRALSRAVGADPMGLLASGALLLCVDRERTQDVQEAIKGVGVEVWAIGEVVAGDGEVVFLESGRLRPAPVFERDEVARILEAV